MGIQNIEALIGDTPSCVIEVGHPAGTPALWRDKNFPKVVVCTRHRDQYIISDAFDYEVNDWERIEGT